MSLSRTKVTEVLKEGPRGTSASPRVLLAGRLMMAAQLSLTIVLLAGAGLMLKSVSRLMTYPPGFTPDQILTMRVDFRGSAYRDESTRRAYARNVLAAAQSLPGVRRAALTTGQESFMVVMKEGQPFPQDVRGHETAVSAVSADLVSMLGMTLVRGRWLTETDVPGAMVVNEAFARQEFPNGDAIGQRIRLPWVKQDRFATIVGVASDTKYMRLDEEVTPEVFVHHSDAPLFGMTVLVQADSSVAPPATPTVKALAAVDPTQSFFSVRTMEAALADSIAPRRFTLLLLGTFALSALFLAVLGVYGVVAYAVAERTHEIGIRIALGAPRLSVVGIVVQQGMIGISAGIVIGLAMALAATRMIDSLLYGIEATDPPTFVLATITLSAIAFVACGVPALRAAVVDPVVALRSE